MKCKLLCVLLWLCATGVSAQHLTVKNYQKKVHPGLTAITMELYRDKYPISNVDWMEYLYWLGQIYGKEAAEYQATMLKRGMASRASRSGDNVGELYELCEF